MFHEPNLVNGCFFRIWICFYFITTTGCFLSDLLGLVSYLGNLFNLRYCLLLLGVSWLGI